MGAPVRLGAAITAFAAAIALCSCAPTTGPATDPSSSMSPAPSASSPAEPTPTGSAPPGATPTPEPMPDVQVITLPTCDQIMDSATSTALFGDGIVAIPGDGVARAEVLPGPAAQKALGEANSAVGCMWGIPNSDGGFHMIVADLPQSASEELLAALRASGAFTETTVGGAPTFGMDYDTVIGGMSVTYTLEGIEWIAVVSSLFDWTGAAPAIERAQQAWIAANPHDV